MSGLTGTVSRNHSELESLLNNGTITKVGHHKKRLERCVRALPCIHQTVSVHSLELQRLMTRVEAI